MRLSSHVSKSVGLTAGIVMLGLCISVSIVYGYTHTTWTMTYHALLHNDGSTAHLVINTQRLPRALIGAAVGASLGVAGVLLQALTRNPLADPKILGINEGVAFEIVFAVSFFSISSMSSYIWVAFLGAGIAAFIVYLLGSIGRDGLTPLKFTLAGASMWALFSSFTQGLLVVNEKTLEDVLFWLAGSVQGRSLSSLYSVLPYFIVGWMGAFLIAKQVNVFMVGEDIAKGLGQRTLFVKTMIATLVIVLAGGAVAIAGPIGFLGIMVPHIARYFVGNDHRWLVPFSALIGGILLIIADLGARYVIMPLEVPIGVMTAIIGAPFFIFIARKENLKL